MTTSTSDHKLSFVARACKSHLSKIIPNELSEIPNELSEIFNQLSEIFNELSEIFNELLKMK